MTNRTITEIAEHIDRLAEDMEAQQPTTARYWQNQLHQIAEELREPPKGRDECGNCSGHGYFAIYAGGKGHAPIKLQRCDDCKAFYDNLGARMAFIDELERGDEFARNVARHLTAFGGPMQ